MTIGLTYYESLTATGSMTRDREQRGPINRPSRPIHPATETEFIDDPHGRHGGGDESEGQPQTRDDDAGEDKPRDPIESDDLP
jgi:hypothetical protein